MNIGPWVFDIHFVGFVIVIIEQFLCWVFNAAPYRYGLTIKKIPIPVKAAIEWQIINQKRMKLISCIQSEKEVFVRSNLIYGPTLFLGRINYDGPPALNIKMPPLTTILMATGVVNGMLRLISLGSGIMDIFSYLIKFLVMMLYFVLIFALSCGRTFAAYQKDHRA